MNYKQTILNIASKVGLSYELMYLHDRLIGNTQYAAKPSNKIKSGDSNLSACGEQILFPMIPGYRTLTLRFCVLAATFRSKGYQPVFLYDDGDLPRKPVTRDSDTKLNRNKNRIRAKQAPSAFGFETCSLGELLDPEEKTNIFDANNIDDLLQLSEWSDEIIKKYTKASLRKYLKQYRLNLSDPVERKLYIEFLQSAIIILCACQQIIERRDIKSIILHEGSYIHGGIPAEVGKRAEIEVYIQSRGYHKGTIMFGRSQNPNFCDQSLIMNAVETSLSEPKKIRTADIMKKRRNNENTHVDYAVQDGTAYDTDKSLTVGVFSHLLWDGALEPEEGVYSDFYTWLDDTISAGLNMNDVEFIIKSHPAEEIRGSNEPIEDWLTEQYDPLPDNISFLPPDTDVNTYQLFDKLDAGVVFASTVGLEMAYHGIPVVVGGFPPYHGCGLTYTPSTKPEYQQLIHNIKTLECNDEMQKRATRFAYFLFECQCVNFPYLSKFSNTDGDVIIDNDEITRKESPYQKIAEQILNGEEVLDPSCRSADNEDRFSK